MSKIISINHVKTCDCSEKHLSCLTAHDWMVDQIGVWTFNYEKRDIRDKKLHPAVYPIALSSKLIALFTHAGELVVDPFVGSGTTMVSANDLGRNCIGFDLKKEYVDLANSRVSPKEGSKQIAIESDARKIPSYIEPGTVKLILTSPPYANVLNRKRKNKSRRGDKRENEQYDIVEQYSQDERDLGTLKAPEFEKQLSAIYRKLRPLLTSNGHVVINITDAWIDGKRVPLHINVVNALSKAGYILRNTIIWDRRNLVNQIGIFGWPSSYITMGTTFEYILDFIPDTAK